MKIKSYLCTVFAFAIFIIFFGCNDDTGKKLIVESFVKLGSAPILIPTMIKTKVNEDGKTFSFKVVVQNNGVVDGTGPFTILWKSDATSYPDIFSTFIVPSGITIPGTNHGFPGTYMTDNIISDLPWAENKLYSFYIELHADESSVYHPGLQLGYSKHYVMTPVPK